MHQLLGPMRVVAAVCFEPSARTLVSVSEYGHLIVWDMDSGRIKQTVQGEQRNDVAFAPEGRLLATGSEDNLARLWTVGHEIVLVGELQAHTSPVTCVAFNASDTLLATGSADRSIKLWEVETGKRIGKPTGSLEDHADIVRSVVFHPDGSTLATAGDDHTIKLWNPHTNRILRTLEGHTHAVVAVSFLAGGELLASASSDGSVWLWDSATGEPIATMEGRNPSGFWQPGVAFHPYLPRLACVATHRVIDVLDLDPDVLLRQAGPHSVTYISAKIVLIGESGVGKTGLGWRLAHGEFIEHASTHGQQFWLLDRLGTIRRDGAQCEAVLWDLAGQPDYRLIHALFLDDADLALLLFDPTRDDDPLRGVDFWLRQLGIGLQAQDHGPPLQAILVAARADRGAARLTDEEITDFCSRRGICAFVTTSALDATGLEPLLAHMREAISWDDRPTTVTTDTFKQIKDYVLGLKEDAASDRVILTTEELRGRLEHDQIAAGFDDDEMRSAVGHLSNHGYVIRLRTSKGETRILLAPELLNNVASSIVLEARRNPKGLGSLEEHLVLSNDYRFPELETLSLEDREVLLDAAVAMFLSHSICFRETDPLNSKVYIVFPELINLRKPSTSDDQPVEDGVAYTAIGAVQNLYASLVVLLGYTSTFARAAQWRHHARYVVGSNRVCGFRLEDEREGELDFVLYFGTTVDKAIRTLFQSLFENLLARRDLAIRRFEPVECPRGHPVNRVVVREQIAAGNAHGFCPHCGARVPLPSGDAPIVLTQQQSADLSERRHEVTQRSRLEQALFRLTAYVTQNGKLAPTCFVSYAWGESAHERWVEALANDLLKAGIVVILDRWENVRVGASVPRFVERAAASDRIIVVGTALYRTKYDNGEAMGGFVTAAEGDLIGTRMLATERDKEAVLPVLLEGSKVISFPPLLHARVYADFRDAEQYSPRLLNLVLSLYQIPAQEPIVAELQRLLAVRP
ncbi:MAG TPA: TIR domain-containing protein [Solirubrobacteraceae bacterium]|nr:TIR domain-containing protein [Solirubrobacteraceae bacterium]